MTRMLDPEKVAKLHSYDDLLNKKYGERGTDTRIAFEERAYASYCSKILKERQKELKIIQQQLVDQI